MYQAGIEGILGIHREGHFLRIDPHLPRHWPGFSAEITMDATRYSIEVDIGEPSERQTSIIRLDEVALPPSDAPLRVPLDGGHHQLHITMPCHAP
ncbi:hypothetical protein D3C78_753360 [compost metagenome]